jgi:hypothetical protein
VGKRIKRLKKKIAQRKKDVDVLQRHLAGKKVVAGEAPRLRRVLEERGKKIRRTKKGALKFQ